MPTRKRRLIPLLLVITSLVMISEIGSAQPRDTPPARSLDSLAAAVESLRTAQEKHTRDLDSLTIQVAGAASRREAVLAGMSVPSFVMPVLVAVISLGSLLVMVIAVLGGWSMFRSTRDRSQAAETTDRMSSNRGYPPAGVPYTYQSVEGHMPHNGENDPIPSELEQCYRLLREIEAYLFYASSPSEASDKMRQARSDAFAAAVSELQRQFKMFDQRSRASEPHGDANAGQPSQPSPETPREALRERTKEDRSRY